MFAVLWRVSQTSDIHIFTKTSQVENSLNYSRENKEKKCLPAEEIEETWPKWDLNQCVLLGTDGQALSLTTRPSGQ